MDSVNGTPSPEGGRGSVSNTLPLPNRPSRIAAHVVRGADLTARVRQFIATTGRTPAGHKAWTAAEDEEVRRLAPDYKGLTKILPHRTFYAIESRAKALGIRKKNHVWTNHEVARLRKLWGRASRADILAAFPGMKFITIQRVAAYRGIRAPRRPLKPTGHPLLDAIRQRCFELNLSLSDLDEMARTGQFFRQRKGGHTTSFYAHLYKAVAVLDGTLTVTWNN